MLKNKNINIILALIIAVSLWAYVLGDVNPKTDVVIKEVPINFENKETLTDDGLVILNYNHATVNVTITGARTEVTKVSKDDFNVTADVEGLTIGSNIVRLNVSGPDSVKISDVSAEKISITLDELVTESKEVEVIMSGEVEGEKEPLIVEMSRDTINVSGAKSLVQKVEKVCAIVDVNSVGNEMKTLSTTLQAVDSKGKVVDYVYTDTKSINVTTIMHHKKTVNLEVPFENESAGGYERALTVPKTIVVKGEESTLKDIDLITCKPIDLGQYEESVVVDIEPILPEGVVVGSDSAHLQANVKVKELSEITLKVNKDNIKINNASEDLKYELEADDISIKARGKEADILGLSLSNFNIYVDVTDLEAGTHTVDLSVETAKDLVSVDVSTDKIEIIIE
ncbi:MAG: hypothetical protein IKU53_05190 [Firmicutes bacterium]|nr:hypothetical protein [Bacillota bacterium]